MQTYLASETFETAVVKTDEAVMLVQAAVENGADLETAYDDMKMIDDLLHMKRLHLAIHGQIKKTQAGHFRKGSTLYNALDSIISARVKSKT